MGELVGSGFQLVEAQLGFREEAHRSLVSRHKLLERRGAARELCDRLLERGEQILETRGLERTLSSGAVQFASGAVTTPGALMAATRPRMPFTKRPDSSPENVLASSMDSLMAALVGTWRSIAIS